jgi:toxin CptA
VRTIDWSDSVSNTSFMIGLAAIGVWGYATQRGGACAVASIVEVVTERRLGRLLALVESSLVVAAGLVLLNRAGLLPAVPRGYSASAMTVAGGVVFGLGAFLNRSCAIGTIARIGSGQVAYVATLVGYFLGCLLMSRWFQPVRLAGEPSLVATTWTLPVVIGLGVALRLFTGGLSAWKSGSGRPLPYTWPPHVATTIAAVAFLVVLLTAGGWTYSGALAALARGETFDATHEASLFAALLAGAVAGGWTSGLRPRKPRVAKVGRCFCGGGMMGIGATLIPGGTDGLTLVGMPLLWPYAWLAFVTMCITIYVAVKVSLPSSTTPARS